VWLSRILLQLSCVPGIYVFRERRKKFSIVPATGLHSESNWFHVRPSEGYLQSKDLQGIFSQFLVFRIGLRKKLGEESSPKLALSSGRKAILLRAFERPSPKVLSFRTALS
jgi:hypothetical protein